MKGMIKILAMACFALALTSCGGSDNGGKEEPPVPPTGDGIPGCWKLTSWQPATNFNKEVYIQFVGGGSDDNVGTFVLYQKSLRSEWRNSRVRIGTTRIRR